jgi:hypothetical protein
MSRRDRDVPAQRPSDLRRVARKARKAERGPQHYSRVNRRVKGARAVALVELGARNCAALFAPAIAVAKDRQKREREERAVKQARRGIGA